MIIRSVIVASVLVVGAGTAVVVTVGNWLHLFSSNPADAKIKPFELALEREGGHKLCGNGDAGFGPDNLIPWSSAYYLVPRAGSISEVLKKAAATEGYTLTPMVFEDDRLPKPDEALRAGNRVGISIYRDADVPLYCDDVAHYGETRHVDGDDVIVEVNIELPSRPID